MTRLKRAGVLIRASFVSDYCLIVTIHSRSWCDFSAQFSSLRHNYGLVKLILRTTTATRSEIMLRLDRLLLYRGIFLPSDGCLAAHIPSLLQSDTSSCL